MKFWLFGILLVTSIPAVHAAPSSRPLRVLCWNIRHGEGTDGKLDLPRIAAVIRGAKPDLVALQEVDQNTQRTGKIDQTAELAKLTGLEGIFGKAMDYGGGAYGQAILSKHPFESNKVHTLPGTGEPRIAFEAVVSIDGSKLRFVSTHLDVSPMPRKSQAEILAGIFKESPLPVILCGDFNDDPESETIACFKHWKRLPKQGAPATHPAGNPRVEIDYVFTLAEKSRLQSTSGVVVLPEPVASDHRPLLIEFALAPDAP